MKQVLSSIKLIGICGGSASGKSTLAQELHAKLGADSCTLIQMDNYYLDFMSLGYKPEDVNYDHPASFDIIKLAGHIEKLLRGESVVIPRYDFKSHKRAREGITIKPSNIIILEGLFLFSLKELESFFSLKIFVDTPDEIRLNRRTKRDTKERGRSISSISKQYTQYVRPMYTEFVADNKQLADLVIEGDKPFDDALVRIIELL